MPKRIKVSIMIALHLVLVLLLFGCGGDGSGGSSKVDPLQEVGLTDSDADSGGNGGSRTACITVNLNTFQVSCANGISEANCSATNQGWYNGLSCADLGF